MRQISNCGVFSHKRRRNLITWFLHKLHQRSSSQGYEIVLKSKICLTREPTYIIIVRNLRHLVSPGFVHGGISFQDINTERKSITKNINIFINIYNTNNDSSMIHRGKSVSLFFKLKHFRDISDVTDTEQLKEAKSTV